MSNQTKSWTIKSILNWTTDYLKKLGIEWPHLEGEILLAAALQVPRIQLYVQHERILNATELAKYKALLLRRSKHEPIAYIVGTQPFMSLELEVSRDALIPRPETEKLVECVLDLANNFLPAAQSSPASAQNSPAPAQSLKILEIGTGSGAIAVSLAKYLPQAEITATDISEAALSVARRNAEKFGVADRIIFMQQDFLTSPFPALSSHLSPFTSYHFTLSNPPYIPSAEISKLMPDVRDFEPVAALDGGPDGLIFIRALLEKSPALLQPKGYLVMEIGFDQKEHVLSLAKHFKSLQVEKDQFGKDRVFVGKIS
jgi:release factor glutamine methyltransferase